MTMTAKQIADELSVFAQSISPFLPPGVATAVGLAIQAMHAIQTAQNGGRDVTPAELEALFKADQDAIADDMLAQQQAARNSSPKP